MGDSVSQVGSGNDTDGRATLREVATAAGVAVSTASRVLNGGVVSDATRARVLAAARTLGYVPDARAQSLRTGSTRVVALVVPNIANHLFGLVRSSSRCA